jgi:hypothetical protein
MALVIMKSPGLKYYLLIFELAKNQFARVPDYRLVGKTRELPKVYDSAFTGLATMSNRA